MKKGFCFLLALLLVMPVAAYAQAANTGLEVGSSVTMGLYEQDGNIKNGAEPIEWLVVDVDADNGRALVVSKYSLDRLLYHSKYEPVTWETCDLRRVLNDEFLSTVFTEEESQRILSVQLHTPDNTERGTKGGNDTTDRVFILSAQEAEQNFPTSNERQGLSTPYLNQLCAFTNGLEFTTTVYWLRTPGDSQAHAAYVLSGKVNLGGWGGNIHKLPIRPAMWIALDPA